MIFLLGACSKSPKEEFVASYESLMSDEYNAGEFTASIAEFKTTETTGAALANMLSETLENMKVKGEYQYNEEDESFQLDAAVEAFDAKMPIEAVGKGEEIYISTSFVEGMLTFMDSFGVPIEMDQSQLASLEGKYLAADPATKKAETEETTESSAESEDVNSAVMTVLEDAKEDSFKKDGDTFSHKFTSAELKKLGEERGNSTESPASLDHTTVTVKINKKTKKTDCTIKTDDPEKKMSMSVKLQFTPSKKEDKITLPKKQDIVSEEELASIIQSSGLANLAGSAADEPVTPEELSDEEFEIIYQQVETTSQHLSDEQKQAMLISYEPYLTPEQLERLKGLLVN